MKQKIALVLKQRWHFFLLMFESSFLGAVIAAYKISEKTLENAYFLRKMYLKEAIQIGVSFGIIIEIVIFILFILYEMKREAK